MTYMRFQIVIVDFTNLSFHVQNFHLTSQALLWCGQAKPQKSPAKNWWHYPPSPPWEARAPGLALGKPSGYTLLAPFLVTHRATPTIHHGACFEASCHWTLLYQMGSINGSARKLFARHNVPRLDFTPVCFPFFQVGIFQSVRAFSWHASWAF